MKTAKFSLFLQFKASDPSFVKVEPEFCFTSVHIIDEKELEQHFKPDAIRSIMERRKNINDSEVAMRQHCNNLSKTHFPHFKGYGYIRGRLKPEPDRPDRFFGTKLFMRDECLKQNLEQLLIDQPTILDNKAQVVQILIRILEALVLFHGEGDQVSSIVT